MLTAAFNFKLQASPVINRDATIRLTNENTGAVLERKPFLDGSLTVRDLVPGPYQMEVVHPNLVQPIDRRRIVLFPQPAPTFVPIPVPADLFRDTPIRDVPDADLAPVQQAAASARDRLAPIGGKSAGEVIRAADWNTLVGVVSDMAGAVLELTQLVSPRGHGHAEIADKIDEVQENLRRFAEAFGRSLLELRREIETDNLHDNISKAFETLGANQVAVDENVRKRIFDRVEELKTSTQTDTSTFTQKLASTGTQLINEINNLAAAQGANPAAFEKNEVQVLKAVAEQYSTAGTQVRAESELNTYKRTTSIVGRKLALTRG